MAELNLFEIIAIVFVFCIIYVYFAIHNSATANIVLKFKPAKRIKGKGYDYDTAFMSNLVIRNKGGGEARNINILIKGDYGHVPDGLENIGPISSLRPRGREIMSFTLSEYDWEEISSVIATWSWENPDNTLSKKEKSLRIF